MLPKTDTSFSVAQHDAVPIRLSCGTARVRLGRREGDGLMCVEDAARVLAASAADVEAAMNAGAFAEAGENLVARDGMLPRDGLMIIALHLLKAGKPCGASTEEIEAAMAPARPSRIADVKASVVAGTVDLLREHFLSQRWV